MYENSLKDLQKQLANQESFKNKVESDINIEAPSSKMSGASPEKV